jgi:hypothetical protein
MKKTILADRNFTTRKYNYYSFLTGLDANNAQNWAFDDVRLPALDEKHAVQIYYLLLHPPKKNRQINFAFAPLLPFLQRLEVFERVRNISANIVQYRRLKDIRPTQ